MQIAVVGRWASEITPDEIMDAVRSLVVQNAAPTTEKVELHTYDKEGGFYDTVRKTAAARGLVLYEDLSGPTHVDAVLCFGGSAEFRAVKQTLLEGCNVPILVIPA